MKSEWKTCKAEDFIEFNPRLTIRKGEIATKITMDKLWPFTKAIPEVEQAAFSGGSKFSNGDTIMARITPCLENGKTAFVNNLRDGEVAFGSTEFIVMRARPGISDPQFVYYLAISPFFRDVAIKSMVGSSGRQRVQQSVLSELELTIPPLDEQHRIGAFLSKLDDKIELNQKINENLEQQAQTIFNAWFVDFEPFGGGKPATWDKATLGTISEITSGKRPPMRQAEKTPTVNIPLVGAASVMGFTNAALFDEKILVTGRVGTHGVIQRFTSKCWASDNTLVITSKFYEFVYQVLQTIDYQNMNRGSTQPLITQTDMKNIPIVLPTVDILEKFEGTVGTLMSQYEENNRQNAKLVEMRDTLLPKLMAGEIDLREV